MDKAIDKSQLRREARLRWLKIGGVGVAVAVAAVVAVSLMEPSIKADGLTISAVDNGPLETTVPASGRVAPAFEEAINSPVNTRIEAVYAQAGDSVKAGTPLLQLDLETEQTNSSKLADEYQICSQELTRLELSNRTLLSELRMQIKVKEMQVAHDEIEVENQKRLDSLGSGTGESVRKAETAYRTGVLELEQLRQRVSNEQQSAAAAEEAQRLRLSSLAKDMSAMSSLLQRSRIPAPHDGVLTFIRTDIGAQVAAGEKVAVVSDLSTFKIEGEIAEGSASRIGVGSTVTVRIGNGELTGRISNITPQAKDGLISFVVTLDDPANPRLRSGLRSDLYINYGFKDSATRLPMGPYFKGPGDCDVFVLDGDDRLVRRRVKLGDSNRQYVEVVSGLKPGDRVVTSDMSQYDSKKSLKIK